MAEQYIAGFHATMDAVARERKYLAFLEAPPLEMTREFVLGELRDHRPAFVALVDGSVVGWCDLTSLHRPVHAHCGVLGIGVLAAHRGHGVGEALIRAALEQAKAIGLTRVELTVRERNARAIALYRKLGFVDEGLKRNAVRIDGVYENLLCMAIYFDEPRC